MTKRFAHFALIWQSVFLCTGQTPTDEALRNKRAAEAKQSGSAGQSVDGGSDAQRGRVEKLAAESMHATAFSLLRSNRVVLNKPYSAEATTKTTLRLADGNAIERENRSLFYRDQYGRTRREQHIESLGSIRAVSVKSFIVISDPVSKTDLILDPARKSIRKFGRIESDESAAAGTLETGVDLGDRVIQGLPCRGKRRTAIIPPGKAGNVLPLTIITETWYSPTIEAIVQSTTSDPRFGNTIYALRRIIMGDPPAGLFQPPPDYTIEFEGRPGTMMRRSAKP